jgi:hypothetical protein
MWRRNTVICALVVVAMAGVAVLAGCGLLKIGGGGATVRRTAKVAEPSTGQRPLGPFMPGSATSFADGPVAVGDVLSKTTGLPALSRPTGGTKWQAETIGTAFRLASDATELGGVQVVVGVVAPTGPPGSPQDPFAAVSAKGAPWQITDLGKSVFGGASAELRAVGPTGNALDPGSVFMAVGATVRSPRGELGSPGGTIPVAVVSPDGTTWKRAAELPLPDGVEGAEASALTYAPSGTAFPGTLVTGIGWADDPKISRREVGIVWHTTDAGKTWKIVSDDNFNEEGRDMTPRFAAADDVTIVVAGLADVPGQKGGTGVSRQSESVEWIVGSDGKWRIFSDGKTLRPERSSMTTALTARKAGGFLTANQIYDTATGSTGPGSQPKGDPAVKLYSSPDGRTWTHIEDAFDGLDQAAIVSGLTEFANRDIAVGMSLEGAGTAWVADRATVK